MRRVITVALAFAVVMALPAASGIAGNGKSLAKRMAIKECKAQKKADKAAFRQAFGPQRAMQTCIRAGLSEMRAERRQSARECRAERAEDPEAFRETYGTNNNKRNAFGKCVRSKLRAEVRQEVTEFKNAAHECRAERAEDPDGFREQYGTNQPGGANAQGTKRNAFGKCVRTKVRQADNGDGENDGDGENGNGEEEPPENGEEETEG